MSVDRLAMVAAAGLGALVLLMILRRSAKAALLVWLCIVCFVPSWFIITILLPFPAATLAGLLLFAVILPAVPRRFTWADWLVTFLMIVCCAPLLVGGATRTTVFVAITQWGLGYALGRLLPLRLSLDTIYTCLVAVFSIVAAGAVIEFFFHWNPFVLMSQPNSAYRTWGTLQERGGIVRAEGAFGHSIALGASIALVIPIALTCRFKPVVRGILTILLMGGAVVTFSRIGIGSSLLGIVLVVVFLAREMPVRLRIGLGSAFLALAIVVQSSIIEVFSEAGSEATNSAAYRLDLLTLVPDMSVLGLSPNLHHNAAGTTFVGAFRSVDSAWLLLGLLYGMLALLLGTVLYLLAVTVVLARRATAPTIAVVAQLPALLAVALITQYAIFFWFFVGLAVASQSLAKQRGEFSDTTTVRRPTDLYFVRTHGAALSVSSRGKR